MRVNRPIFLAGLITVVFIIYACVEEFWPDISDNHQAALVVDGKITNFPGPYTVKLSSSSSIKDTLFIPKSNAIITIIDNKGNQEILNEKEAGIYQTSSEGIQGIIGNAYKINIELENGEIYSSEFEELLAPIGIDEVFFEKEWQFAQNELETDHEGFQFYVNTKPTTSSSAYLFWEVEETYEYHASYRIYFMYNGPENNDAFFDDLPIRKVYNLDTLYNCWKTQTLHERLSYGLDILNSPNANNLPLHYIAMNDDRLRWGYNILVKQFTISKAAYTFLDFIKKQNENQGTLYRSQPFRIRGNIRNTQDSSEEVLGYFMVASGAIGSRAQTRAPSGLTYDKRVCYYDTTISGIKYRLQNTPEGDWPIFFSYYSFENRLDPLQDPLLAFAFIAPSCLDCRLLGGVAVKPEYWEW